MGGKLLSPPDDSGPARTLVTQLFHLNRWGSVRRIGDLVCDWSSAPPRRGHPLTQTVLSLFTIAVVISGSVLGGFLGYIVGWYQSALDWRGILVSILGSLVVLWLYRRAMRPLVATSSVVQPPRI